MRKRAPSAVSNWIADGKLTPPALVQDAEKGELIDVEEADKQLAATLDPSQQLAQADPIGVQVSVAPAAAAGDAGADEKTVTADDPDNRRFVRARADKMESEAEGLVRERNEETGKWLDAEKARAAFGKEMAASISEVEAWLLGPLSEIAASEVNAERKAMLDIFRREWRAFRARQAAAKRGGLTAVAMAAE